MTTRISRRTLLRGAGVTLGLPWLEAMMPSSALAHRLSEEPCAHGGAVHAERRQYRAWYPEGTGRDFKLSPTLEPLQDLKDQILVLSNLWNAASKGGDGHYVKEAAILTCTTIKKTPGVDHWQRHFRGPGGGAADRRPNAAAVAGTRRDARSRSAWMPSSATRGSTDRTSPGAVPTTPLAREINPRFCLRAAVPRSRRPAGRLRRRWTRCCSIACSAMPERLRAQVGARGSDPAGRVSVAHALARRARAAGDQHAQRAPGSRGFRSIPKPRQPIRPE